MSTKVVAAMSGGVDSSVAAALLKKQGFNVIGVTMQVWPSKKALGGCCTFEAIDDASRVADCLNIPHYILNFRDAFKEKVVDNFVEEYKNGRTPNPCIRCNQFIKFDHLMEKAKELGAEYVATGHYARIKLKIKNEKLKMKEYLLFKGTDKRKDQAYVLYMMGQKSLAHTLFPNGELTKAEVRKLARDFGLPVHDRKESQEICFIEDDDYARFLREVYPEAVRPGPILDKDGNILGMHGGIAFYTLGQRRGIGHHRSLPKYVIQINRERNAIVIGGQEETLGNELLAERVNYVSGDVPQEPLKISAKIRYNSPEAEAVLYPLEDNKAKVVFKKRQRAITPGQSVVFYKGDEVIGGGIIS
ncbi:thiouridylase [candidate division WOR-1 bacterium DG_54_3]|uniref:tRNA-specific 2-thiouridylase MnmA n=1 Tax=candidate division WOR-1 bacterium DG_54_3 TaxID=1703775 RepID=A0A0S7Y2U3_UNCSA|nr:MAG: thiouridylase [candidate division WOR-1 bacterium DG_54_3]